MAKNARRRRSIAAVLLAAAAGCGPAPEPEEAAPHIPGSPRSVRGKAPPGTGAFPTVVLLQPETPMDPPEPAEPAVMDQYGTAFHPKVLLVRPGQPVDFKNSEDVLHNVHVIDMETRATEFNVGTPVVGSYRHRFEREGVYDVSCEIHPSMAALVIVTSALFAVIADAEGRFELASVPEGSYRVTVWNLDPGRRRDRTMVIREGAFLDLAGP